MNPLRLESVVLVCEACHRDTAGVILRLPSGALLWVCADYVDCKAYRSGGAR